MAARRPHPGPPRSSSYRPAEEIAPDLTGPRSPPELTAQRNPTPLTFSWVLACSRLGLVVSLVTMSWQDIELYAPCGERFKLGDLRHFYDEQPTGALIADIAQALGNIGRFGGRTRRFLSVAEHSINVAELVRKRGGRSDQILLALMHDCAEAFLGDIPTPMKPLMTLGGAAFADVETHVYGQIAEILGLPENNLVTSMRIRKADTDQRIHEEWEVLGKPEFTLAYPHSFTEAFLGAYEFWNNYRGKLSPPIMTTTEVRERIESQEAGRG